MTKKPNISRKQGSGLGLGLFALVAMALCCALPVLVGAGALAAIGGVVGNIWVIAAAVVVAVGTLGYFASRRRANAADCCAPSTANDAATENDSDAPIADPPVRDIGTPSNQADR
jgi:mercuric ion transport protein